MNYHQPQAFSMPAQVGDYNRNHDQNSWCPEGVNLGYSMTEFDQSSCQGVSDHSEGQYYMDAYSQGYQTLPAEQHSTQRSSRSAHELASQCQGSHWSPSRPKMAGQVFRRTEQPVATNVGFPIIAVQPIPVAVQPIPVAKAFPDADRLGTPFQQQMSMENGFTMVAAQSNVDFDEQQVASLEACSHDDLAAYPDADLYQGSVCDSEIDKGRGKFKLRNVPLTKSQIQAGGHAAHGGNSNETHAADECILKMLMPNHQAGAVIGARGAMINTIMRESECNIQISNASDFFPGTRDRIVVMKGSWSQVQNCTGMVIDRLRSVNSKSSLLMLKLVVPNSAVSHLMGFNGERAKMLIAKWCCKVNVSGRVEHMKERIVAVCGEHGKAKACLFCIASELQQDAHRHEHMSLKYEIRLDEGVWFDKHSTAIDPEFTEKLIRPEDAEKFTKRRLIEYLNKAATQSVRAQYGLQGTIKNMLKTKKADDLHAAIKETWLARTRDGEPEEHMIETPEDESKQLLRELEVPLAPGPLSTTGAAPDTQPGDHRSSGSVAVSTARPPGPELRSPDSSDSHNHAATKALTAMHESRQGQGVAATETDDKSQDGSIVGGFAKWAGKIASLVAEGGSEDSSAKGTTESVAPANNAVTEGGSEDSSTKGTADSAAPANNAAGSDSGLLEEAVVSDAEQAYRDPGGITGQPDALSLARSLTGHPDTLAIASLLTGQVNVPRDAGHETQVFRQAVAVPSSPTGQLEPTIGEDTETKQEPEISVVSSDSAEQASRVAIEGELETNSESEAPAAASSSVGQLEPAENDRDPEVTASVEDSTCVGQIDPSELASQEAEESPDEQAYRSLIESSDPEEPEITLFDRSLIESSDPEEPEIMLFDLTERDEVTQYESSETQDEEEMEPVQPAFEATQSWQDYLYAVSEDAAKLTQDAAANALMFACSLPERGLDAVHIADEATRPYRGAMLGNQFQMNSNQTEELGDASFFSRACGSSRHCGRFRLAPFF